MKFIHSFLLLPLFFTSCETDNLSARGGRGTVYLENIGDAERTAQSEAFDTVSYWDGDGISGSPSVKIRLGEQKAYFYKGKQLVGVSKVSSGRKGFETPTGSFTILQKNPGHKSNLYGVIRDRHGNIVNDDADARADKIPPGGKFEGAPMPYFMRMTNSGVGMHEGYIPGYAASHGCIRLPGHMAQKFFSNVELGTPVTVTH